MRAWLEEHKAEAPVLEGPGALTEEDEIVAARRVWQRKLAEGGPRRARRGRRSSAARASARSSR